MTGSRFGVFAPFEKVQKNDDGTLYVEGFASSEARDHDGERVTAGAMRDALPDYMRFGAVREMHGLTAAGTAVFAEVQDDGRTRFGATIVDPITVKKIEHKVLKGFSILGKAVRRGRTDPTTIEKLRLTSIDVVDRPSNPDSVIDLVKFDTGELADADEEIVDRVLAKIAARKDTSPSEGKDKYGDVTFADPTNKKYPLDSVRHIRSAWRFINESKNAGKYSAKDAAAIKRRIVSAWKSKIDKAGPPSAAKAAGSGDDLVKGMYSLGDLAGVIGSLECLLSCRSYEEQAEDDEDGQALNVRLAGLIDQLGQLLLDMTSEEVGELHPDYQDTEDDTMSAAAGKTDEVKKAETPAGFSDVQIAQLGDVIAKAIAGAIAPAVEAGIAKAFDVKPPEPEKQLTPEERIAKLEQANADLIKRLDSGTPRKGMLRAVPISKAADTGGDPEGPEPEEALAKMAREVETETDPRRKEALGKAYQLELIRNTHRSGGRPLIADRTA